MKLCLAPVQLVRCTRADTAWWLKPEANLRLTPALKGGVTSGTGMTQVGRDWRRRGSGIVNRQSRSYSHRGHHPIFDGILCPSMISDNFASTNSR